MGVAKPPPRTEPLWGFALEDPGVPCGAALQFQAFSLGTAPGEGGAQVQPGPSCPAQLCTKLPIFPQCQPAWQVHTPCRALKAILLSVESKPDAA